MRKRNFLAYLGSVLVSAVGLFVFDKFYRGIWGRNVFERVRGYSRNRQLLARLARIRSRRRTPIGNVKASTPYLNTDRNAPRIHLSNAYRAFRFPKIPKKFSEFAPDFAQFEPVGGPAGTRIVLSEASWGLEQMAIEEALRSKDLSKSCDILLCAIKHDLLLARSGQQKTGFRKKPNFRIYDLLAGLSARAGTPHLETMLRLLETSREKPAFQDRIEKWSKPAAASQKRPWRKLWTVGRKSWKTSIADGLSKAAQKKGLPLAMSPP